MRVVTVRWTVTVAVVVFAGLLASTALAQDGTTSREWNRRVTLARAAKLRPEPIGSKASVVVPQWSAYLRQALMPRMDPERRGYRPTYVRCWNDAAWQQEYGRYGIMGFYQGGAWVHVRYSTCLNAAKAARGQLSTTNAVALATVMHETFHRQGIHHEEDASCLGTIAVWDATWRAFSEGLADRAWARVAAWYRSNTSGLYRGGMRGCVKRSEWAWNDYNAWE
jgi:hypothetical protein